MEYREAVQEARGLVKRSEDDQWRLAQLTWEQVEAGKSRRRWAADIGVNQTHANRLYRIWARWGEHPVPTRPTFPEAYAAVREGIDAPPEEAIEARRHMDARSAVRNMPPEQQAEVVREALQDPEVAEQVVRDHEARRTVRQATDRYDTEHQERARQDYELREPRSVQIGANADMQYALTKARTAMEDAREAADKLAAYNWPDNSREIAETMALRVRAGVELFLSKVRGEDLDEELQALLKGGDA